jgi:hypothetical protein
MLSAIARLEFEVRDSRSVYTPPPFGNVTTTWNNTLQGQVNDIQNTLTIIMNRLDALEHKSVPDTPYTDVAEILEMRAPENSRDIIIHSPHCTPALSAAVASANPPEIELESEMSEESEEESEEENDLKPIKVKGVLYYLDSSNTAYTETEDGYEEVGKYDPVKNVVEVEEEEEGVEVEDFLYKGNMYQRDSDNNVYLDGEQVGTWNGKRILPI